MKSNNNGGHRVAKEIIELTTLNEGKKINWRYGLKNKLIFLFIYYLK